MQLSHHPGCPVPLTDLRYLRMTYVGFDGNAHVGELAIHRDYARRVATVFERLYDARWPIRRMRLVDDYAGSDTRSMAADNTSGFNCRRVAGSRAWSAHAYGAAVDINPVQNPDLTRPVGGPPSRTPLRGRRPVRQCAPRPRRDHGRRAVVRAFARIGWEWGGAWSSGPDYQHFSAPDQ